MAEFDVWSRPEHPHDPTVPEPLFDHLVAVENHCLCNTPASTTLSDGTATRPVLQVMAWLHDVGKLTTWWQEDHGNTAVPSRPRDGRRVGDHSFIGGVATWWVLDQLGYNPYICLVAGIAVARHHNTLPDLSAYFSSQFVDSDRWETVGKQVTNIETYTESEARLLFEVVYARSSILSPSDSTPNTVSWDDFRRAIQSSAYRQSIKQAVTQLTGQKLKRTHRTKSTYDDLLELWGGLKAADSPASAGISPPTDSTLPSPACVESYVQEELSPPVAPGNTLTEQLNYRREQTRQEILANLDKSLDLAATATEDAPQPGRIYTLTLPTGAGKTISGTQAALQLHAATKQTGGLVYILPYTSLIDQTESVYRELFNTTTTETNEYLTPEIAVDHYLADGEDHDSTEEDTDENMDTTNLWYSDITLSTTVQLWETLYGPSKSQVLKLPQLYESTVIIDEPQSLPTEWFARIEQLLSTLTEQFGANVLLMSATQPPIRYPTPSGEEPPELAPEFSLPDNTTITLDQSLVTDSPLTDEAVATRLYNDLQSETDSILSIHNTINNTNRVTTALLSKLEQSADSFETIHTLYTDLLAAQQHEENVDPANINIYDLLPSKADLLAAIRAIDADILVVPLTTRHRPCDRTRILQTLTTVLENRVRQDTSLPQIVTLTTQLVEAGVDISFASLYRDLAPYDSLIQAAGRCNRNYEYGRQGGDMTIWQLADNGDGSGTPAEYVYLSDGVNRLACTKETLLVDEMPNNQLSESTLIDRYSTYKSKLRPKLSLSTPDLENINGKSITQRSLITTPGETISVCISRSPVEDQLQPAYTQAKQYNPDQREVLRSILSHIECSLRVDDTTTIQSVANEIDTDLYFIDSTRTADFYSLTGLSSNTTARTPESDRDHHD